jgi:hypothetical protein
VVLRKGEETKEGWNRIYKGLSNRGKKRWKQVSMMQKRAQKRQKISYERMEMHQIKWERI